MATDPGDGQLLTELNRIGVKIIRGLDVLNPYSIGLGDAVKRLSLGDFDDPVAAGPVVGCGGRFIGHLRNGVLWRQCPFRTASLGQAGYSQIVLMSMRGPWLPIVRPRAMPHMLIRTI